MKNIYYLPCSYTFGHIIQLRNSSRAIVKSRLLCENLDYVTTFGISVRKSAKICVGIPGKFFRTAEGRLFRKAFTETPMDCVAHSKVGCLESGENHTTYLLSKTGSKANNIKKSSCKSFYYLPDTSIHCERSASFSVSIWTGRVALYRVNAIFENYFWTYKTRYRLVLYSLQVRGILIATASENFVSRRDETEIVMKSLRKFYHIERQAPCP